MDWLLRYADVLFGVPAPQEIENYLGGCDACYLGYASEGQVRVGAASGGIVSALLIHLLEEDTIQGALISKVQVRDSEIQAHPFIARNREEILGAQSSIYMGFPWLREARPLLQSVEGRVAVVGLPCFLRALRHVEMRDPQLSGKIEGYIGLICGRSSLKTLLLAFLSQKGIEEQDVADIRFREGHWRGRMSVWLRDGSERSFPFDEFSLYRNLHFHCEAKCLSCEDPLAEGADVVCGDAWLHELKKQPVKHSLVISRTSWASGWIEQMAAGGKLTVERITLETAFRAQRRGLIPAKRGKQAKVTLGKAFGLHMQRKGPWRSRWNDYLMAGIVLTNHCWARSQRWAGLIFRMPKPVLQLYLMILSFLKQF